MKKPSIPAKIRTRMRAKGQLVRQNGRAKSAPSTKKGMAHTNNRAMRITILNKMKIDLNFNGKLSYNLDGLITKRVIRQPELPKMIDERD
jgi:hypothetical protein